MDKLRPVEAELRQVKRKAKILMEGGERLPSFRADVDGVEVLRASLDGIKEVRAAVGCGSAWRGWPSCGMA